MKTRRGRRHTASMSDPGRKRIADDGCLGCA
jgi:hypothetical protein